MEGWDEIAVCTVNAVGSVDMHCAWLRQPVSVMAGM